MSDELRRECEAFLDAKPMSIPITEEPECVDALLAFTKAQRSAEVRAFQARIEEHHAKDHWYFKSIKQWLDQRAKEWEG
jgi:hypothetical protein